MNLTNTQFVFESKTKTVLIGGMILGAVCLALSAWHDDQYLTRFWTNYLHNAVFFTGIAFMATFFLAAQIVAFGGWNTAIKRVWEAMGQFLWVGIILLGVVVLGVWGHFHHLYLWNMPGITDPSKSFYDKIITGKSGFLNPMFYTFAVLIVPVIWYFWARNIRQASVDQDSQETATFDYYKRQRKWAASFLPLGGFLSTVFLWQSVMSVDPHWYSTMFAWYSMVSVWLASMSLTIMLIIYLKSKGYMEYVNRSHLHDIGKYLFGISVFWTYLWFDQFMLIWYANNGEETVYFNERMTYYPVLFWGNLLMNFVTPFFILMRNDTKRKFGTMFFVALIVFFGHWWDYFYMIKPGARITAHEITEFSDPNYSKKKHHAAAPMGSATSAAQEMETTTGGQSPMPTTPNVPGGRPVEQEGMGHRENNSQGGMPVVKRDSSLSTVDSAALAADTAARTGVMTDRASANSDENTAVAATAGTEGAEAEGAKTEGEEMEGAQMEGEHGEEQDENGWKSFKLGYTIPGLEELGVMIGFLSLFLFFFFGQLAKSSLLPLRDPYLEESLHHDTGTLIETEVDEHDAHH
ncbi:MAG: hypothetical protein ABIQ93_00925 [Saprospiraceae bacterium]